MAKYWNSKTERTKIYYEILEQIATELFYEIDGEPNRTHFTKEHCRIDFVIGPKLDDKNPKSQVIPIIAIESENDVKGAEKEISALCSMKSPIKVLITCAIWDSDKTTSQPLRADLLRSWRHIYCKYKETIPSADEKFWIIVGEGPAKKRGATRVRFFEMDLLTDNESEKLIHECLQSPYKKNDPQFTRPK